MNPSLYLQQGDGTTPQFNQQGLLGLASLSAAPNSNSSNTDANALTAPTTNAATTSAAAAAAASSSSSGGQATTLTALNAQSKAHAQSTIASTNALNAVAAASAAAAAAAKSGSNPVALMGSYQNIDAFAVAGGMQAFAPTSLARNQSLGPYLPPTLPAASYAAAQNTGKLTPTMQLQQQTQLQQITGNAYLQAAMNAGVTYSPNALAAANARAQATQAHQTAVKKQ